MKRSIPVRKRQILAEFQADQHERMKHGELLRTPKEFLEDMRWQSVLIAYQARKYGVSEAELMAQ